MTDVHVPEDLWSTAMAPEGVIERWRRAEGDVAAAGTAVAAVRIEGALHELIAPAGGRLTILAGPNAVVEPGSVIDRID